MFKDKKILIVRFSSLGDIVLSSVVLEPLYKAGFKIDFLLFKEFSDIFTEDYRINKLITIERKNLKTIKDIKMLSQDLKKENYQYILDLHSNLRSFLISKFLRIKTFRYNKNSIRRRLYIYPFFRKFLKGNFNVIYAYLDTLKQFGIENLYSYRPRLIVKDFEKERMKDLLPNNFVVIGAGARYKKKFYPYYKDVSELLLDKGFNVVLIGSSSDREMDTNKYSKEVLDLRGKLSLRESLATISLSKGTISNDSAIAHLSRAVGKPVLMVYGATHEYFGFYPLKDEGDFIGRDLKCRPCDLHGKGDCKYKTFECLEIPPKEIVNRFLNLV